MLASFGGALGITLGVIWAPESQNGAVMADFSVLFSVPLKRSETATKSHQKRRLFGGGRHGSSVVNSCPNLVFHVFAQAPFLHHFWDNFGLHLGVIWGGKVATILFWGRLGGRFALDYGSMWPSNFTCTFLEAACPR